MKNKSKIVSATLVAIVGVVGASLALENGQHFALADTHSTHVGKHYIRKEATESEPGVKEYVVCCEGHEHYVAEADEFFVDAGWGDATKVQFKILNKQVFPKSDFLSTGTTGFEITYGEGSVHAGWFSGMTGEDGFGYITPNFNSAVSEGATFSMKEGSYITSTDNNVYYLAKDVSATYTGGSWVSADDYAPTLTSGEASGTTDDRYIPCVPKVVNFSLGWSSGSNVQLGFADGTTTIADATDGDRLTVSDSNYISTNIDGFNPSFRVWNGTVFGLDPTTLGSSLTAPSYVHLFAGLLLVDKNGHSFELENDFVLNYQSSGWSVYDASTKGVVTSASIIGLNGTIAYVSPTGTNLPSYAAGTNTGGIIPSQAQYTGSIKFCGVEFNDLKTFSSTIHLFGTINGAAWNDGTLSMKIYDNDTWESQGYSHITDFSGYDFGMAPQISIKAGTVVTLTNGDGGTYLFESDAEFVYNGTAWAEAE